MLGPISLVSLLTTLVLLFGFQGEQILAQPLGADRKGRREARAGVRDARLSGAPERRVAITIDQARLQAAGLTSQDIRDALATAAARHWRSSHQT